MPVAGVSAPPQDTIQAASAEEALQTLTPGDVIKVSFPGTPRLDTTQKIRRDGRINLSLVGEVMAEGKTPAMLEADLVTGYAPQLNSKEIKVTVVSSSFSVFVSGAVLKPGKIMPERAVTALDAVMEAGGFDMAKADLKAVRVIRRVGGKTTNYVVDLDAALRGQQSTDLFLKPFDIVFVPERFSLF